MRDTSPKLLPESVPPELRCDTVDHGGWDLEAHRQSSLIAIVFYRGHHSDSCREYLQNLNKLAPKFAEKDVELIAISGDDMENARQAKNEWKLDALKIGCSLQEFQMNAWGLFLSDAVDENEPPVFCEPAVFVIEPTENKIKYAALTSGPFARPDMGEVLKGVQEQKKPKSPARGSHYNPALAETR